MNHPVFDESILDGVHLLEADAGTGKTWTIAGLVVRAIVERGLDIGQVLVVTFTNAATAELAERIRQRIAELERLLDDRIEGRDDAGAAIVEPFCVAYSGRLDDEQARSARSALRIALARIDEMSVHTIHGYCQRVIDEHALSIGVARGLPIHGGRDRRVAQRVAQWWRDEVIDAPADRLLLVSLAGLTPESLRVAVEAIVALPLARIGSASADWRSLAPRLAASCGALADAVGDESQARALREWLAVKGNADRRTYSGKSVVRWIDKLRAFCDDGYAPRIPEEFQRFTTARFSGSSPPSSIPASCDALLALHEELLQVPGAIAQEIANALQASRGADLADAASLGFDDLLRLVHDALADPTAGDALAQALRERHPVALVDECQDTDALQWEIVRRVWVRHRRGEAVESSTAAALVLVGDPKQAIYAFRGADLHSYLHARSAASRTHRLGENQRSSRALIEAVNTLFERPDPFLVDEIEFHGASYGARPRPALEGDGTDARAPFTVVTPEPDPDTGTLNAVDASRQVVQASVAEIARLLAGAATYDARPLRPGDIAVLVNSHRQGALIKRALAAAGIGAAEISRDSVLDTLECRELLRVIAAIADPGNPEMLRSALTTTLFGADAKSLAAFEANYVRAAVLAAAFAQARDTWDELGPIAALRPLLRLHGTGERLAALRDGDRRLTNLMHLIELLADDASSARSPRNAVHAWSRLRDAEAAPDTDTGELRLESDENLVRIVTVHKSKGLEFPIVFLPFAWSARAPQRKAPCTRHERDEEGGWRVVLDFAPDDESAHQSAREAYAESLRTLYVAVTRARQRCYLFWGAASQARNAALAWLLHGREPPLPGRKKSDDDKADALHAEAIASALADWQERANRRVAGSMIVVDTPTLMAGSAAFGAGTDGAAPTSSHASGNAPVAATELAARPWRSTIGAATITTSFSAIAAHLASGDSSIAWRAADFVERPDHDQQPPLDDATPEAASPSSLAGATAMSVSSVEPALSVVPAEPAPSVVPAPPSLRVRFDFPAGAQAGVCLHGILEEMPFDGAPSIDIVARWLARSGYARVRAADVASWLAQVVATPLPDARGRPIALASIPAERQLREMDFHLSGSGVADRAVLEAVATEFDIETSNVASRWSGFLRGFVDLVFEHDGRYYIVDWKSNHLGDTAAHYARTALDVSMRAHAYPLQASLYTLALHRWLRRTVRGYEYERHFGGVFYVFLRGAGLDGGGAALPGVHASRPTQRLVAALDRIFAAAPTKGAHR